MKVNAILQVTSIIKKVLLLQGYKDISIVSDDKTIEVKSIDFDTAFKISEALKKPYQNVMCYYNNQVLKIYNIK